MQKNLEVMLLGIVLVSVIPMIVEYLRSRGKGHDTGPAGAGSPAQAQAQAQAQADATAGPTPRTGRTRRAVDPLAG